MSSFRADRESVALLRASARALIDETISEPCWGLAHGLAELIERLVSSSGKPAEYFGKGGPPGLEMLGERTCCPACGEWAGQHEGWCSHAHEGQAEAASLESLLTWLDLSGLPPLPPARKPTNWRFDGPEGGEQIPY